MYMCVCVWRGSKQAKPKSWGTNAENMGGGGADGAKLPRVLVEGK